MRVLLIGGTGIISSDVCNYAKRQGYDVYILNRGKRKDKMEEHVHWIVGDIKKETANELKKKLKIFTFDVVVDFLSYDVMMLEKLISIAKCQQYIFVSTAAVYNEQVEGHYYKETDAKGNKGWEYCAKKFECEKKVSELAAMMNIKYTIVRPYVTYNETRFPYQISPILYYTIVERIKKGLPIPIYRKGLRTTVTDSRDFAVGMTGLFLNPKAYNEDFHITTDSTVEWRYIAILLSEKYHREIQFLEITEEALKREKNTVIDIPEILKDKAKSMVFDNSKIKEAVPEFQAELTIGDSIDRIYKYYMERKNMNADYLWMGCLDRLLWKCHKVNQDISVYDFSHKFDKLKYFIGRNSFFCFVYLGLRKVKQIKGMMFRA